MESQRKKEKTGIFGGTFDPIHRGHLKLAEAALKKYSLDRVLFVPTGNPPHKVTHMVTAPFHRYEMVKRAIAYEKKFLAASYEVEREGDSYTIDTVREVRRDYPESEIYIIVGTDVLCNLIKWKESDEIFRSASFVCAKRDEDFTEEMQNAIKELREKGCNIEMMDFEPIEISSTEVREELKQGGNGGKYLTPEVVQYIKDNDLYGNAEYPLSDEDIQRDLKDFLKKDRYEHSLRVMKEAVRIGKILGADEAKCKTAGLLHDCGKNLGREQLKWLGFDKKATEEELYEGYNKRILHGKTGVIIARQRYGINDPEILEAIENHITGKPGMSLLASIIFLADYTEEGREGRQFEEARRLLKEEGLYRAMLWECDNTMKFVMEKGEPLDINTVRTRNWLINELRKDK